VGCAGHRDNLGAAIGYIGDRAPGQARDWRQGIKPACWACARQGHPLPTQGLRGRATWDNGWTWGTWVPPQTAFEQCLHQHTLDVPDPPAAMQLAITVMR